MKISTAMILKKVSLPAKVLPNQFMPKLNSAAREAYKFSNNLEAAISHGNHLVQAAKFASSQDRETCIALAKEFIHMKAHYDPRKNNQNEAYGEIFSKLIKQLLNAGYQGNTVEMLQIAMQCESKQQTTLADFMRQATQEVSSAQSNDFYLINMQLEQEQKSNQQPQQTDICAEQHSTLPSYRF